MFIYFAVCQNIFKPFNDITFKYCAKNDKDAVIKGHDIYFKNLLIKVIKENNINLTIYVNKFYKPPLNEINEYTNKDKIKSNNKGIKKRKEIKISRIKQKIKHTNSNHDKVIKQRGKK